MKTFTVLPQHQQTLSYFPAWSAYHRLSHKDEMESDHLCDWDANAVLMILSIATDMQITARLTRVHVFACLCGYETSVIFPLKSTLRNVGAESVQTAWMESRLTRVWYLTDAESIELKETRPALFQHSQILNLLCYITALSQPTPTCWHMTSKPQVQCNSIKTISTITIHSS